MKKIIKGLALIVLIGIINGAMFNMDQWQFWTIAVLSGIATIKD